MTLIPAQVYHVIAAHRLQCALVLHLATAMAIAPPRLQHTATAAAAAVGRGSAGTGSGDTPGLSRGGRGRNHVKFFSFYSHGDDETLAAQRGIVRRGRYAVLLSVVIMCPGVYFISDHPYRTNSWRACK